MTSPERRVMATRRLSRRVLMRSRVSGLAAIAASAASAMVSERVDATSLLRMEGLLGKQGARRALPCLGKKRRRRKVTRRSAEEAPERGQRLQRRKGGVDAQPAACDVVRQAEQTLDHRRRALRLAGGDENLGELVQEVGADVRIALDGQHGDGALGHRDRFGASLESES